MVLPVLRQKQRILFRVLLHPKRRIGRIRVLPASKPEEYEAQMVLAGFADGAIHQRKVELAGLRLDQFPRDRRQDCIHVGRRQFGPERLHVLHAGGSRISQLAGQDKKRAAIHDHLCGLAALLEVWNGRDGGGLGVRHAYAQQRNGAGQHAATFHSQIRYRHAPCRTMLSARGSGRALSR